MAAKIFEVNDVLPATTQLRIYWKNSIDKIDEDNLDIEYGFYVYLLDGSHLPYIGTILLEYYSYIEGDYENATGTAILDVSQERIFECNLYEDTLENASKIWTSPYTDFGGNHAYIDIDTSTWTEDQRTIDSIEDIGDNIATFEWENMVNNGYSITYEENGGTTFPDIEDATELPDPLPIPTKSGYTFLGWYYDSSFTNAAVAGDSLTSDVTLYAKWQLNTYTITFNSNGGSSVSDITEATELPTLPIPTKSGYTFVAWYYDSAFTQKANAGDTIESNVTLYAKWHNLGSLFTEIADAIRSKDGTSESIRDVDFGERIKQIQGPKEEQTKTVSPTTSSQDVLPDANKVLSKVTVNAIPTETKSQQPNLSSGDQTINATSGKFMTSFTITKDTVNHIASNIRSGITLYGVTGNLQPAKEEETKTVTPNFSSGSVDVTPTTGKVLSQVTINKDSNLIADNIKKDVTVHGITGTLESGGGGGWFDYSISGSFTYNSLDVSDPICLVFLFGKKSQTTTIGTTTYYRYPSITAVTYILETPYADSLFYGTYDENLTLRWEQEVLSNAINFKAPFDPAEYECLGLYFASQESMGSTTLTMSGSAYDSSKTTPTAITNGNIFKTAIQPFIYASPGDAFYGIFSIANFVTSSVSFYWFPKLTNISLYVEYDD